MRFLARSSHRDSAIAPRLLGAIVLSFVVVGCAAGAATAQHNVSLRSANDQISARRMVNNSGEGILTWSAAGGARAIAFDGSTDVTVVLGNTLSFWSDGSRHEQIRYHDGGLWRALRVRFGVTKAGLDRALNGGTVVHLTSPLRRLGGGAGAPPPTVTIVDNYGTDLAALKNAAPIPISYVGDKVLGYRFVDTSIASVRNTFRGATASGAIVSITYSSNPSKLGNGDHRLVVTLTDETSTSGRANETFLGGGRPTLKVNGLTAYKANANQVVFRLGRVIAVVTSTLELVDSQWRDVLNSVRSP